MVSNIKNLHSVLEQFEKKIFFFYKNKRSKFEIEKVAIRQYFSISGNHLAYTFLIFVFCLSQIKNYIITGLVSNFFYAPCNRVTSSLQKRNHHKSIILLEGPIMYICNVCALKYVEAAVPWEQYLQNFEKTKTIFKNKKIFSIKIYLKKNKINN